MCTQSESYLVGVVGALLVGVIVLLLVSFLFVIFIPIVLILIVAPPLFVTTPCRSLKVKQRE